MEKPLDRRPALAILEDDPLLRRGLERALVGDFEVSGFEEAPTLLDELRDGRRFDVMLVDYRLPGMSGEAFVKHVARELPDVLDACILMTGMSPEDLDPDLMDLIDWRVAQKPFSMGLLGSYLREQAERRGQAH